MEWRLIDTGFSSPAWNMAIDEAMLICHSKGLVSPTLRFYGWQPQGVTLGYFQKSDREINIAKCEELGIPIVRRLTGGRAVLHEEELTYSIVIKEDHPIMPKGVTESYKVIAKALIKGLENLGLKAELAPKKKLDSGNFSSAACFDAPSTYELAVKGKKIIGSAQVRKKGVILQHGSILDNLDIGKLVSILNLDSIEDKKRMEKILVEKATCISKEKGERVDWDIQKGAFEKAFVEVLMIKLTPGNLTPLEISLAEDLLRTKYSCKEWNFSR